MVNSPVEKANLPTLSLLNTPGQRYDYVDSYSASIEASRQNLSIEDVGKAFFASAPPWVDRLFMLRNKIVGVLGLKTPGAVNDRQHLLDNFKCETGEQLGLFRVFEKNERELLLGEDDKHLNFRVSLFIDTARNNFDRKIIISTVVTFRNWLGRLYFLPVKQFHRLIVPVMLKRIVAQLRFS